MKAATSLLTILLCCVTAEAGESDVVLNEIHYNASPDTGGGEFLEIANYGSTSVEIGNWALSEAVEFVFPEGTTIGPGEYLLLANNPEAASAFYGVEIFGEYTGRLANGGETIILMDSTLETVDVVTYDDDSPWPTEADGGGPSLALRDPNLDRNDPSSWGLGQPYSPGAPNDPVDSGAVGNIVISEIMYKPLRQERREKFDRVNEGFYVEIDRDEFGEYVEIINVSAVAIDLTGWKFTDGIDYQFEGVTLEPSAFLIVVSDVEAIKTRYQIDNVAGPFAGGLDDGGERLTLRNADGDLVDTVRYNDRYPWPLASDDNGSSLEIIDPTVDNTSAANWRASEKRLRARVPDPPLGGLTGKGTPGSENSVVANGVPPSITELEHLPEKPSSSDDVRVTVQVSGGSPLTVVELHYWFGSLVQPEPMIAPMFDDGLHDDGESGDGLYATVVPRQPSLTFVNYRVRAVDSMKRETVFPYDNDPAESQGYFHYDNEIETTLPVYFLFVDDLVLNVFQRNPRSDRYHRASLAIDGDAYPDIGLRLRGRGSRISQKRQWKFRFNRHQLYDGHRVLDTMMRLPFLQWLAFQQYDQANIRNLEHELARVYLNGEFFGTYIVFGSPNATWLRRNGYENSAEVYKARTVETAGRSKDSDLFRNEIVTDMDFWGAWNKKIRSLERPTHIRELTDVVNDMPDAELLPWLDANVNIDEWNERWIFTLLMVIDDFTNHNYYLFRPGRPDRGGWTMLGYDFDSLGRSGGLHPFFGDSKVGGGRNKYFNRISCNPTLRRMWWLKLRDVLENEWNIDEFLAFIDEHFERVAPDRALDKGRWGAAMSDDMTQTKLVLSKQSRAYLRAVEDEGLPGAEIVPKIEPPGATSGPAEVTLSVPSGWVAVYSVDGSDPRLSVTGEIYRAPFTIEESSIVRAAGLFVGEGEADFESGAWTDLASAVFRFEALTEVGPFIRGDFNGNGDVEPLGDAIFLLRFLFELGGEPPCLAACDLSGDGRLQVTDPVRLLLWAFRDGGELAAPFPECGVSELEGDLGLGCLGAPACR